MATETGYDWRLDSPWRRLPWTAPGAILIGLVTLWALASSMRQPLQRPLEPPPIDARLIALPSPPPVRHPVHKPHHRSPPGKVEPQPAPQKMFASLAAPSAPTADDWKLASTYTLRNSKRYRHSWGQLVRSMMGTAVEGPDQGMVRFRIEVAPDGKIAKVEELWSTSRSASKLAWEAIRNLPPTPPTPTGKPLIFEQTISFMPYETGWPPSYQLDCLPEPQQFKDPFVWDGTSPPPKGVEQEHRPPPPEGCPPDSTEATIEEEDQSMKRQMDQWRYGR